MWLKGVAASTVTDLAGEAAAAGSCPRPRWRQGRAVSQGALTRKFWLLVLLAPGLLMLLFVLMLL